MNRTKIKHEVFAMAKLLITGGTGYIGSHTAVELLMAGHDLVIVDNLSNSKVEVLNRIYKLTGKKVKFYEVNLLDKEVLKKVFQENEKIDAVIHLASHKVVGESVANPLKYYYDNIMSALTLLECMSLWDVKQIVFSSTAAVYGLENISPLTEDLPLSAANPYGRTKLMIEQMMTDLAAADASWSVAILRYFNAVGAHESGQLGEDPSGVPSNLMPYITQVAVGKLKELQVFGGDYETPDGTGIRDYIHVTDLAIGHMKALNYVSKHQGIEFFNLGTEKGNSVLEVIKTFEKVSGINIPYSLVERRAGDVAINFADASKAKAVLGWSAKRDIEKICQDAWRWQKQNPEGY